MAIHHWSTEKQPRQKLVQQGADRLTDAELLAIFLRTGVRGKTAVQLSEQLLEEFGSLTALLVADYQSFTTVKGLGIAKYAQLQAMLELAKRYMYESVVESSVLDSPAAVRTFLHLHLKREPFEKFILLHLDNQHRVIKQQLLFSGTIDCATVYPRVVVEAVLKNNSAAVIFAHNHPITHHVAVR